MILPILLVGAGGHARACIDVIESEGKYSVYGLVGLSYETDIVGTDDDLPRLLSNCPRALVTVGQIKSYLKRFKLFTRLLELGFQLPTIISPAAYVSPFSRIGMGSIIMHGAVINAGAIVGNNCIINSRSLIEHDVVIGDHCHISTGAVVNGATQVGEGSFVGSGSVLREGIRIAPQAVIGMGSIIRHDHC